MILHDITERERCEERVRQSQKMEAMGQLVGGIAHDFHKHDFNNMLTIIAEHGDLLAEDAALTETHRRSIEQIRQACLRASALTAQRLAFGRGQLLCSKVLDFNEVVADMEAMPRPLGR